MPEAEAIRAAVEQRFAQVARSPEQETNFPVGPASATKLGYDPLEIDALPPLVTESWGQRHCALKTRNKSQSEGSSSAAPTGSEYRTNRSVASGAAASCNRTSG